MTASASIPIVNVRLSTDTSHHTSAFRLCA
jgi:hypothetical protein